MPRPRGQYASVARAATRYEYRMLTIGPEVSRSDARRLLTDEAEYGHWELARSVLFTGGRRKVWLRRKTMQVRATHEM